ncbi:MAG: hypothetical protein BRD50_01195 [Bacteroidetes bacterium SW_11_45_7]|nr:MAG: hypothetical protein BRD50_01195 [Bacteroidetes bacterium SW_11_45_7]
MHSSDLDPKKKILFRKIDRSFLEEFHDHLKDRGCKESGGIGFYMRHIRAIYNEAIREGYVNPGLYPFWTYQNKGYKIPNQ